MRRPFLFIPIVSIMLFGCGPPQLREQLETSEHLRQRLMAVENYWCEHNGSTAQRRQALLPVYQTSNLVERALINENGSLVVWYKGDREPSYIHLLDCDELAGNASPTLEERK